MSLTDQIAVMQAAESGARIQWRPRDVKWEERTRNFWRDCNSRDGVAITDWNFAQREYRIRPAVMEYFVLVPLNDCNGHEFHQEDPGFVYGHRTVRLVETDHA